MAITLNVAMNTLGITAPVLGPWFSQDITLAELAPQQSLRLPVSFNNTDWLPPTTGTLSLFIANGSNPSPLIAHLQDAAGNWPFTTGRLIGYFRLLPEVEARLDAFMRLMPPVTTSPPSAPPTTFGQFPTRARVRALAMEISLAAPTPANVLAFFNGQELPPGDTNEQMEALGLAVDGNNNVVNGAVPMTWLRRPGRFNGNQDRMLSGLTSVGNLWAFDQRGRAIDPGAVAAWWSWLFNTGIGDDPATGPTDYQLMPPGLNATPGNDYPIANNLPVVATVSDGRTIHLVDPHEGPLGAPFILASPNNRLLSNTGTISGNLLAVTSSATLSFSSAPAPGTPAPPPDNPTVDDAPLPRMAVLPDGDYGVGATLWPGPVDAGLARDFVRVAVLDEERHLLGIARRDSRTPPTSSKERQESSQNRPSTRTSVSRTADTAQVLQATADAAASSILGVFAAGNLTRAVLGVGDVAWGPNASGLATITGAPPYPPTLVDDPALPGATYRVTALAGGGALSSDDQAVLVEVNLGNPGFAGAWVRAWPLGFNLEHGLHFRLSGGGGRVDGNGIARLVMTLANGKMDAAGLLGMDLLVCHLDGTGAVVQRSYADRRFARPAPDSSAAANASTFNSSTSWVICETGTSGNNALASGSLPPGATIVVTSGSVPAIVDRTTIPVVAWSASLGTAAQAGDIISLTQTAFESTPDRADPLGRPTPREGNSGDPTGGLSGLANLVVHRVGRESLVIGEDTLASSAPYSLHDRLEVAATRTAGPGAPVAAIGGAPPLPWVHEMLPHFLGHPGAPAAIETHGTGVALNGPPANAVAEYVRERTAGLSFGPVQNAAEPTLSMLVQSELAVAAEAATPLPAATAGTTPGPVVGVLRTGPVGQEGFPGAAVGAVASNLFPFSQDNGPFMSWIDSTFSSLIGDPAGGALRSAFNAASGPIIRAVDRRIQVPGFGAREVAWSLAAAFGRAQDLIYIETPAVDNLAHGPDGDTLQLWQVLISRMSARRGLQLVLCVPTLLMPGTPRKLQEVRNATLHDAVKAIRDVAGDRVAVFSPGASAGRAVRLATTSVVVDDVLAITGTTHLWRRGLTWDSSLAAAVFDERVVAGRSREVRGFRLQLLADRLGLPVNRIPLDGAELVRAVRDFDQHGSVRRSFAAIVPPETAPTTDDLDIWNPDGTEDGLDFSSLVTKFAAAIALTDTDHAIIEG